MANIINTWQFNLIAYLLCVTLFASFYKLAVRNAKNDGAATVLLQIITGVSLLFISPLFSYTFSLNLKVVGLLFFACIFYALNDRLQTTSRKHIEVSLIAIIGQLATVFLIIIGFVIFKEEFLLTKILGAILILLSNFIVLYKRKRIELNKYVLMGILSTVAFAIALSIDIGISKHFNLPIYIAITLLVPAIFILLAEKIKPLTLFQEYQHGPKRYYWLTSICWGLLIIFSLKSFQLGKVTTIVPLQAVGIFTSVLVAYFFMNEKTDPLKKLLATVLIIIGVYLTVI